MEMVVNNAYAYKMNVTSKEFSSHYVVQGGSNEVPVTLLALLLTITDIVKGKELAHAILTA